MDFNALTYNTVDPPDPPRWRPQAVAVEVNGRFALQMSVLADTATGPGAPSRLEASQGDARVGLFWFAPVTDGGSAITHYEYRYQAGTGSYGAWTQVPDSDNDGDLADERKLVVSSLTNDVAHFSRYAQSTARRRARARRRCRDRSSRLRTSRP